MLHGRALELQLEAILQACTCTGHSTALDKKRSSAKPCGSYCQQRGEPCFVRPQISRSAGAAALQKKSKVEPTKQVQVRDRGTPWANIGHMPQVELETLEEVSTRPKAPNGPVGIEEMNSCAARYSHVLQAQHRCSSPNDSTIGGTQHVVSIVHSRSRRKEKEDCAAQRNGMQWNH